MMKVARFSLVENGPECGGLVHVAVGDTDLPSPSLKAIGSVSGDTGFVSCSLGVDADGCSSPSILCLSPMVGFASMGFIRVTCSGLG